MKNLYPDIDKNNNHDNSSNRNSNSVARTIYSNITIANATEIMEQQREKLRSETPRIPRFVEMNSVFEGIENEEHPPPASITDWGPDEPLVVLFSALSSRTRGTDFAKESRRLKDLIQEMGGPARAMFGETIDDSNSNSNSNNDKKKNVRIVIETHRFSDYTLEKQIQMASRTAVFITFCGGGAITASFLPKGAAVQVYYNELGGIENNKDTSLPARLDWDFFNNLAYLHVNWIPSKFSKTRYAAAAAAGNNDNADNGDDYDYDYDYADNKDANADIILKHLRRIYREREKFYERKTN